MEKFQNPSEEEIKSLLKRVQVIAVVGLSPQPSRPSYRVASNLQRVGYRIIPVRPAVETVLGEKAYARLAEIREKVDMVDVFRAPEYVDAIVEECIVLGIKAIWLQDGVVNEPAALRAQAAGMTVVMDRCAYRDYVHFFGHAPRPRPSA